MTASQATRKRRRRLTGEDGFIIVEVLVSAVILLTVSLAAFLLLDNADRAAGNQQKRSLAANFAQSELERIRSLPVEDIAAARGTKTITQNGIEYTETITAKWVTDGKDEPECTTRSGGLDYLRTTVSISWKGQGSAKPVTMTSYYTPSAGAGGGTTGSVSVHITDRNGGPVSGIGVTLAGAQTFTETTNVNGCVVFGFVPAATDYTVKFSRSGFVDGDSNPSVADGTTVTAGETTKLQYDYDSGGFTKVAFLTRARGAEQTAKPLRLQFFNAAQPSGPKTIDLGSSGASSWDGSTTPLFPFTSPYAVYGGNCASNAPPAGANASFVNITPNQMQNTGTVYMPALDVTVRNGTPAAPGAVVSNALVMYDPGCTPYYSAYTTSSGQLPLDKLAYPYTTSGVICAAGPGNNGRRISKTQANVNFDPTNKNGTVLTLYLNDTGSKSTGWTGSSPECFS